jgi:uncharacterized protein (TIGR03118 family)
MAPVPAPTPPPAPTPSAYSLTKLVSDGSVSAQTTDANLKNPWGIVFAPNAPVWIANNATQTSTLYDGTGVKIPLTVTIPPGTQGPSSPTGIVANSSTTDFSITANSVSAPARFIFAGEGGTITGWAPSVNATNAVVAYDDGAGGAIYKGLTIAANGGANFLYAADFHNNKIVVFDASFHKVTPTGGFTDSTLPAGYAPFGIQALQIQNQTVIVVAYAKQDQDAEDNVNGAGLGLVDTFDVNGTLLKHLVAVGGALNAPWGIALAPANFGTLSNMLLVGNFGDGVINGYDPSAGTFVSAIKDSNGQPIATPGLWGIAFGNGARNQPTTTLYFAAGIAAEVDGLYGRIDLGATPPDTVAPTTALTAPAAGTVSGTVAVTATAADNVGVKQVQFFAGTTSIGTATAAPFTVNWDTTAVANGAVSLTAQAQDAAGNITTSAAVAVTVNNTATPPPPAATTLSELQSTIFSPICSTCHNGVGAALPGSMNLSTQAAAFAALVNVPSSEVPATKRVNPGDPTTSYIINKLEGTQSSGARMPFGLAPLDQATIDKVKSWISAGAQNN